MKSIISNEIHHPNTIGVTNGIMLGRLPSRLHSEKQPLASEAAGIRKWWITASFSAQCII
jgi:hypothetical protein